MPTYVECASSEEACDGACVDMTRDVDNCGGCGNVCDIGEVCDAGTCLATDTQNVCMINNGGCDADAMCMDIGGSAACACNPGFVGDGMACDPCALCDPTQYASMMCTPFNQTVCTTCAPECGNESMYEAVPCGPFTDRVCAPCTQCGLGQYTISQCMPQQDRVCGQCDLNCVSCDGPGSCFQCDNGFSLQGGICVPTVCGNAVIEGTEECDDGDTASGDGCSTGCTVEADSYCFGEVLSTCRPGSCITEAATALPLGAAFELDGDGTASSSGLALSQRSMIRTTAPVQYPVVVEATVVYSGDDVTYAGARGNGLRDPNAGAADEPTDNLRGRLSAASVDLATGPGTTVIATTTPTFTPQTGVPYRVRYIDDGFSVAIEWFNLSNLSEGVGVQSFSSYHGSDDRAFVGGGDQGAVTFSDIRVCSAPELPITSGLVAHFSAIPSWTVSRDVNDLVSSWADLSGSGHALTENGPNPTFLPGGAINTLHPGIDFDLGGRLATAQFTLTTDVSVFAVIHHRPSAQWGALAHHGSRDLDWSMEQNGTGDGNALHWQTSNDNTNMNLSLTADTPYVMTGIFDGLTRYFSATTFDTSTITPVTITDASHSITATTKAMYVGSSDANEASNAVIGQLLYFNRALSDAERDEVIAYLRALWRPQ